MWNMNALAIALHMSDECYMNVSGKGAPTSFMNDGFKLAGHCRDVIL